ncbi:MULTISPECIES: glutathione S-transferase family protein [unclassified Rhizobium]|uniref:glutathione S-transferase family protein n=1 Tax=unclassified Rhizobium TaxID=2613769 RepID=UPI001ADAC227|nr:MULTISPECIES: glutathione S-transferase family protein [unclassified Rhizobium]MBO9097709.1 glutathione S-transferase family protein [Rhizobium sp. L58/93]MBO9133507.1 glutathione S-transferase family protein [Rhizobium sp. B209b/85]MBO9167859.1 glutathione S-transferase family protein [Rhizobium sp. L245/93]MBO9183904.1 glutathione S-transferase family protein [Rhizobium sp. E27B/91]QXZ84144.1 glutathione S-transferase family protein [Rhizobium sp. K1/93]
MTVLYYSPGSCALASLIAMEESGIAYEPRRIDLSKGDQKTPEYLKLNPKGRVPTLVTERGVITETPAILAYISQVSRNVRLAPLDDSFAFAVMQAFNNYLSSTVHVNHAHGRRGSRWSDDAAAIETMKAKVSQTMTESFVLIEDQLLAGPWVLGGNYSVADGYLFTVASWLPGDGVDMDLFPKVKAHGERMRDRAAVQQALAIEKG